MSPGLLQALKKEIMFKQISIEKPNVFSFGVIFLRLCLLLEEY